ncbi:hypothetical protein SAMN05892883_1157 [Jatrophihabitans sp. GAS493]|nr:hypothetical protein SAMN05892883_1157 [Jatrophihabitans sp. GAS493]
MTDVTFHEQGVALPIKTPGLIVSGTAAIVPPGTMTTLASEFTLKPAVQMTITIYNGSPELVGPVKVRVVNNGLREVLEDFAFVFASIRPTSEESVTFTFPWTQAPGQPSLGSTIVFRDSSGTWWRRHLVEPIERVHADPENGSLPKAMRDQFAANAAAMGSEPTPEPRVSWRTRLARRVRTIRGESGIP